MSARTNPVRLRGEKEVRAYGAMVASAYTAAPDFVESEVWRWRLLAKHIDEMFTKIQRGKNKVRVVFEPGDAYGGDAAAMKREIARTGVLVVSTDNNEHAVFDHRTNLRFRAIHDYVVHVGRDTDFSLRGEIASYNIHARIAPKGAVPALFTEIVGQASVVVTNGYFPPQKIALLDFDYYNVGEEVLKTAVLGRPGEAFTLSGRTFERFELRGTEYHRTHKMRVEYDRRHQRFHFEPAAVKRVPTAWITALDAMARKVLPAQT